MGSCLGAPVHPGTWGRGESNIPHSHAPHSCGSREPRVDLRVGRGAGAASLGSTSRGTWQVRAVKVRAGMVPSQARGSRLQAAGCPCGPEPGPLPAFCFSALFALGLNLQPGWGWARLWLAERVSCGAVGSSRCCSQVCLGGSSRHPGAEPRLLCSCRWTAIGPSLPVVCLRLSGNGESCSWGVSPPAFGCASPPKNAPSPRGDVLGPPRPRSKLGTDGAICPGP